MKQKLILLGFVLVAGNVMLGILLIRALSTGAIDVGKGYHEIITRADSPALFWAWVILPSLLALISWVGVYQYFKKNWPVTKQ